MKKQGYQAKMLEILFLRIYQAEMVEKGVFFEQELDVTPAS